MWGLYFALNMKQLYFDCKMSTRILYVRIKYSMYDLICDVISCCIWSCDMDKINVYDKIVMQNKKKGEIIKIEEIYAI